MAIKVNGTTVIDDSRNMSNVGTVTATTFSGSGANLTNLPASAFAPAFDPTDSPGATLTSSGSWSKPGSIGNDDWVVFYLVGGGGGGQTTGSWQSGGTGGNAAIIAVTGEYCPASVSFTIGAGGSGGGNGTNPGGSTSCTISGNTITADGGAALATSSGNVTYNDTSGSFIVPYNGDAAFAIDSADFPSRGGGVRSATDGQRGFPSIFGGGGGGSNWNSGSGSQLTGGTSTYAGNGGTANASSSGASGSSPGGGGAGNTNGGGNGAGGSVRVYYYTS